MRHHMARTSLILAALLLRLLSSAAQAKGLDELESANPENDSEESEDAKPARAGGKASGAKSSNSPSPDGEPDEDDSDEGERAKVEVEKKPPPPSELSKALAQKLFLNTGMAWVSTRKSSGDWKGKGLRGMADLTVGYQLPVHWGERRGLAVTYRYAPIAVSGLEEEHSYRGVWEIHNLGARYHQGFSPSLRAVASAEAGYVLTYLNSTDGLEAVAKHSANGLIVNLGGGGDWSLLADNFQFAAGPRLYAGFGTVTTIQVGGAVNFLF